MLEQRGQLENEHRLDLENSIVNRLIQLIKDRNIRILHTYLPMGLEIDFNRAIYFALEQKITVVTTKTLKKPRLQHLVLKDLNDLASGVFGTKYPNNSEIWTGKYDMIIVPGLAFDRFGNRLGYGGGYYDHFLSNHPNAFKVALCFPFQILPEIPTETHDQPVSQIIY